MLIERNNCTVCLQQDLESRFSFLYKEDPLKSFLINYYNLSKRGLANGWDQKFGEFVYTLLICRNCKAVIQKFAPSETLASELYGVWLDGGKEVPQHPAPSYRHHVREANLIVPLLLRHTGKRSPAEIKILDFGCGWGGFAMAMRALGCEVFGLEYSEPRIEYLRRNGVSMIEFDEISSHKFDFINTEQVMEHVVNPLETARLLKSGLTNSGILKISVPYARWAEVDPININWQASGYELNSPMPFHPLEHLTYYRRETLSKLVDMLGMYLVKPTLHDELNASFDWFSSRIAMRNLFRLLPRHWFRNYLFLINQK